MDEHTADQQTEATPVDSIPEESVLDVPNPGVLAEYLTGVYTDEEASNFERTMAAVALNSFWLGCELARVTQFLERVDIVDAPMGVPKPRMN